ncbi:putative transposase [Variovorax sp. HW608]|nr:putative transposase [Variovorax sp. HW608]
MKRSRFAEEQITYALRLADSGTPVVDMCRQIGIWEGTFYTPDEEVCGPQHARTVQGRVVADQTLGKQCLQGAVRKELSALPSGACWQP